MTLLTHAAVDIPLDTITDSFAALLAGFRQAIEGLYAQSVASFHYATGFGEHLLQHPAVLIAGILIGGGGAAGLAAWLRVVLTGRHVAKVRTGQGAAAEGHAESRAQSNANPGHAGNGAERGTAGAYASRVRLERLVWFLSHT